MLIAPRKLSSRQHGDERTTTAPSRPSSEQPWRIHAVRLISVAFVSISFLLTMSSLAPHDDLVVPKMAVSTSPQKPAILPFALSVNHLQRIELASGALEQQVEGAGEDFLPILDSETLPIFRFRLKPAVGVPPSAMKDISAYRIVAQQAYNESIILWDSEKIVVKDGMPDSIPWKGDKLKVGTIVQWRAHVWDKKGFGPSISDYSKFGVGPSHDEWVGQWIIHPKDINQFSNMTRFPRSYVTVEECGQWKKRRPLPVARGMVKLTSQEANKKVVSALLVVSGLGSFATTFDGMSLSSSSVLDPPMTDFTQRVSYRGFDVTSHFEKKRTQQHVVGVTLGSGWWDARPLMGRIVKFKILPRGPLTTIAELHLKFDDGSTVVKIPTGTNDWQIAKGFIRDSDLFTGDTIDLGILNDMKAWDSPEGWNTIGDRDGNSQSVEWINPVLYKSDITTSIWRRDLSEKAGATKMRSNQLEFAVALIGELVPAETPPVLPIERLAPESIVHLGNGRWLYDFGKAMSGVLHFNDGLPTPIVPETYPRSHQIETRGDENFITVVYGDSIQMETGDTNLIIVAGLGLHDGGPRQISRGQNRDTRRTGGPCFPRDHGMVLTQRDAFVVPKQSSEAFAEARQSIFTSHGFRFAEVCCTEEPPNVHAVAHRTAFPEWGKFDSSNVLLNGAYELTRNALNSNMLGTQTDCPHREKLQYGGDIVADSTAAMHFFDLSAFYTKVIHDWTDAQWENGGYTETSLWQDLNDYAGIGKGAGETVWASLPPVLTVRHMQHYADMQLAEATFDNHVKWLEFLEANWEAGMARLFYDKVGKDLKHYDGGDSGLGDWLALRQRDTWLTHHAFYMASARAVGYLARRLEASNDRAERGKSALALADKIMDDINALYMANNNFKMKPNADWTPGPELGLFARIVPGKRRCTVLRNWIRVAGSGDLITWSGDEEQLFFRHLSKRDLDEMIQLEKVKRNGFKENGDESFLTLWKRRHNTPEGILAIRYSLKALSDIGFHNIALSKVTGDGCPSFEYMLSHNATTMWESWWRSEDLFSRNHPMLGAVSEWIVSSVAGASLAPTTIGGRELLFWPRIPTSAVIVQYASAIQGTKRGEASVAWEFQGLPDDKSLFDSAEVKVRIRVLVPPASTATLKLPTHGSGISIKYAYQMPDLEKAQTVANTKCSRRRRDGMGFHYNWEYDRVKKEWSKFYNRKSIGTPCRSYLFETEVSQARWSPLESIPARRNGKETEIELASGLYDVAIERWKLVKELEDWPGYGNYSGDLGPHCSDSDTFTWDVNDATHMI